MMRRTGWKPEDILFEDHEILVCRKHAGIAVQSARIGQMDMESAIKIYLKGGYVGIVQRLDQPVEGVLVFGKTSKATAALNRQLQNGKMKKQYLAVYVKEQEGSETKREQKEEVELEDFLLKDGRSNTSRVVPKETQQSKKAVLRYQILEEKETIGLAKVTLLTGRHHQIRVQMAHHGMPLWGDGKYNKQHVTQERENGIGLCSYRLEFSHPKTGKRMEFQIKPEGKAFQTFVCG